MSPPGAPGVLILVNFEDPSPHVVMNAVNDEEYLRLRDWLVAKPKLFELVSLAFQLERAERAA